MGHALVVAFFILIFSGMPIAYVLGITGVAALLIMGTVP